MPKITQEWCTSRQCRIEDEYVRDDDEEDDEVGNGMMWLMLVAAALGLRQHTPSFRHAS
jgi:hypothetical protein